MKKKIKLRLEELEGVEPYLRKLIDRHNPNVKLPIKTTNKIITYLMKHDCFDPTWWATANAEIKGIKLVLGKEVKS